MTVIEEGPSRFIVDHGPVTRALDVGVQGILFVNLGSVEGPNEAPRRRHNLKA